jgi:hypothetical protein
MSHFTEYVRYYWKAVIAFVAPGAVMIGSAVLENSAGGETITQGEWITALVAAVVASTGVAAKSNGPAPTRTP